MEAGLVSLFWPFCGFFAGCRPALTIPTHLDRFGQREVLHRCSSLPFGLPSAHHR